MDLVTANGSPTNGNGKKDEEPPAVMEAPELVLRFFDGKETIPPFVTSVFMTVRLDIKARLSAMSSDSSPSAALHVATLAQEVRLIPSFMEVIEIHCQVGLPVVYC